MMPQRDSDLERLTSQIETLEHKHREKNQDRERPPPGPTRISIELFSGVLVGSALGYYLDQWLGTLPIFFIVCFFFGVAGGALNIYKLTTSPRVRGGDSDISTSDLHKKDME